VDERNISWEEKKNIGMIVKQTSKQLATPGDINLAPCVS
jgi:hypothetical protein